MKLLLVAALFISAVAEASIVPKNPHKIPVGMKSSGGLTKEQFEAVITKVETIYSPLMKEMGKNLLIKRLWEDPTVNATAEESGGKSVVNMYGGLARHASVTQDSFALVVCHELGHHIGGAPKFDQFMIEWATIESQADYFATLKCLRRVFLNDDNANAIKDIVVPKELKVACSNTFKGDEENICIRSGMASLSVLQLISFITGEKNIGSFSSPDPRVVTKTSDEHSTLQCRLDTFFQGSICDVPVNDEVSQSDEVPGTCHPKSGHATGLRPACWHKAQK